MPSLMSIRVQVDSEVKGIESIVPIAPSLVKKGKNLVFLYQRYCKFWKKNLWMMYEIIKIVVPMHPKLHSPTSNNNKFSYDSLGTNTFGQITLESRSVWITNIVASILIFQKVFLKAKCKIKGLIKILTRIIHLWISAT